jgi:uncharacterized sulfatase
MKAIRSSFINGTLPEAGVKLMAQKKPVEELFDLNSDPQELKDLSGDPKYKELLLKMRNVHKEWSTEVVDAGLIPEPILRKWENDFSKPIYNVLRENEIPMDEIQEVALGSEIDLFTQNLFNGNEAVRYWAATGIGNYPVKKSKKLVSDLKKLLDDNTPVVRVAAARALCILDLEKEGLKPLSEVLADNDEWNRLYAALVLDEIGEKARPTINALQSVMDDKNKYVVRVANHALNAMLGTENVVK